MNCGDIIGQPADIGVSVLALGAVLVIEIEDSPIDGDEDVPGLHRACLAAIRPQLVGTILEHAGAMITVTSTFILFAVIWVAASVVFLAWIYLARQDPDDE